MKIALPKSVRRERLLVIILPLNQAARRAVLEFEIVLNFVVQATNRAKNYINNPFSYDLNDKTITLER